MRRQQVSLLATYIPDNCDWLRKAFPRQTAYTAAQKQARCLSDPAAGYNFVISLSQARQPFPPAVAAICPVLYRLYCYRAAFDPIMTEVLSLLDRHQAGTANVLNALLLAQDTTYRDIAADLGLREDVVRLYHELLFNVKDRLNERAYIASIVYPQGRLADTANLHPGQALLIAGCEHGRDEVLRLAGMHIGRDEATSVELAKHFEQLTLRRALDRLQYGDCDHPLVKAGLKIADGIRKADVGTMYGNVPDDVKGLTAISLNYPVADMVREITEADIRHRQILAQEEYEEAQRQKTLGDAKPAQVG
jgi:hypothetical protein